MDIQDKNSEARLRGFFELPIIGIAITSPEKGWLEVNQGVISMLGYSREELAGLTWADLTHPEDLAADVEQFNLLIADQQDTYFLEKRFIHKNGKIIWTKLSIGCVRKPDRSVDYTIALLQDISEQKKTEQAMRQTAEKFRSLYENMSEGQALHTLIYDDQGNPVDYRIVEVNPAFEAHIGISRDQVINKSGREAYGVDEPPYLDIYSRVALTGKPEVFETYFAPLDKYFSISVYCPMKGTFATIFDNITKRRKAEEQLKAVLTKYQVLFDVFPVGITITDELGNISESNRIAEVMLGISKEEQEKRKIDGQEWRIIRPDGTQMPVSDYASVRALEEGRTVTNVEMGIVKGADRISWINVSATPIPIEGYGVAIVYNDISESKKIEQELKESEKKYRDLFEKSQVGMFRTRIDGSKVLDVNDTLCKIMGFSKEEMTSNASVIRYADPKRREELISLLKQSTKVNDFEAEIVTKDNSVKVILMSMTAYPEKGILEGSFVDITDRKKAEAELKIMNEQLRELNATKDKFFSIIAHDLINPFNSILGFSDTLLREGRDLEIDEIMKYIDIIHSSAHNTHRLLENLLDWARMQQGSVPFEAQPILLNSLVKSEIEHLKHNADQKNIKLTAALKEELILTADEKMLGTVLRNLISNAIKFTRKSGEVIIGASRKAGQVEITVSDNGIGMSRETLGKLFRIETSFTTRGTGNEKGSGLGLLLCKEFVEKHGGTISVESKVGSGSTFKVSLPVK